MKNVCIKFHLYVFVNSNEIFNWLFKFLTSSTETIISYNHSQNKLFQMNDRCQVEKEIYIKKNDGYQMLKSSNS